VTIKKSRPERPAARLFRLRDHGMPRLEARGHGDLFVKVMVDIPKDLTARQRELLREFARTSAKTRPSTTKSVLRKIFGELMPRFWSTRKTSAARLRPDRFGSAPRGSGLAQKSRDTVSSSTAKISPLQDDPFHFFSGASGRRDPRKTERGATIRL